LKKQQIINSILDEQGKCIKDLVEDSSTIEKIVDALIIARNSGKKVFAMGNGGSGSTASHFVSDLLKTAITKDDKRFSAISLVDNIPVILAWSNDKSYEDVFIEQLKNFLSEGDVVIGFSGSGKSKNVVNALEYARKNGAVCIGVTGMSGGQLPKLCHICLIIESCNMLTIESMHLLVCHCVIETIRSLGKPVFTYE
jgi:D-sedoheptulose 7-phosphate isomerase